MASSDDDRAIRALHILKEAEIAAPLEITFESVIEELGPSVEMPGGKSFPMVLEPWPGGRWYRDLGDGDGHFWGHVQVIKPPTLLELCGPMFMSYPSINHVQYRLSGIGARTTLTITHRAIGQIPPEVQEGAGVGWDAGIARIRAIADRLSKRR